MTKKTVRCISLCSNSNPYKNFVHVFPVYPICREKSKLNMASKTLFTLLAVAMVFSLATAFYDDDEDLDLEAYEEIEKRNDAYQDHLEMDKRSYPSKLRSQIKLGNLSPF